MPKRASRLKMRVCGTTHAQRCENFDSKMAAVGTPLDSQLQGSSATRRIEFIMIWGNGFYARFWHRSLEVVVGAACCPEVGYLG